MRWVRAVSGDFKGTPPSPRSGHSTVRVGASSVVVFGGLVDKTFLQDVTVLDTDNDIWFTPPSTVRDSDVPAPSPRAFHVAVAMDTNMFVFGGRGNGRKRLGDFWMLDTVTWQWAELVGFGDIPPARDFAAGASVGNGKIVIYGGWDGDKWLSDVFVLDTMSLEWQRLPVVGPTPPPRCGHSLIMLEKRMLIFGGRGGGGPILGDLWALKGLFDGETEPAQWTQLKLPGSSPAARCGHSVASGGSQLFIFGGHGTAGWLTRYDIYFNDVVVLDRATVQWKQLTVLGDLPPPVAYHSMTRVRGRLLLFGGYDGKAAYGDIWWLVPEGDVWTSIVLPMSTDDPTGNRALQHSGAAVTATGSAQRSNQRGKISNSSGLSTPDKFRKRLGLPALADSPLAATEIDKQGRTTLQLPAVEESAHELKVLRDRWSTVRFTDLRLGELELLLSHYQELVVESQRQDINAEYRFFHFRSANEVRMDDVDALLSEYRKLTTSKEVNSVPYSLGLHDHAEGMTVSE